MRFSSFWYLLVSAIIGLTLIKLNRIFLIDKYFSLTLSSRMRLSFSFHLFCLSFFSFSFLLSFLGLLSSLSSFFC